MQIHQTHPLKIQMNIFEGQDTRRVFIVRHSSSFLRLQNYIMSAEMSIRMSGYII